MIFEALAWLLSCVPGALEILAGAAWDEVCRVAREAFPVIAALERVNEAWADCLAEIPSLET